MIVCLLLITLAGSFTRCTALKSGAPEEACSTLLPMHRNSEPQKVNSPYAITAHDLGDTISVKISSPTGESFKGFILQARSASNKENLIHGEFETSPISKGVNCEGLHQSALTHVNNDPKSVVLTKWNGSSDEDIIFRATVVKDFTTFWTNIDSDPVSVKKREIHEKPEVSASETCAKSEYCMGLPEKCLENDNCKVILKMKPKPSGTVKFSLSGVLEEFEYMAMGISEDQFMGEDFVTECLRVGPEEVKLRKSWNKGKSNQDTTDISESGERFINDGKTTCTWVEPRVLDFKGKKYDLSRKPYILLANGLVDNGEKLGYHYANKLSTSGPIEFFRTGSIDNHEDGDKKMTEEPDVKQKTEEPDVKQKTEEPDVKQKTEEPDAKHTTELTSESILADEANSCLQLNLNLFWLSLFVIFCARGRNLIQ